MSQYMHRNVIASTYRSAFYFASHVNFLFVHIEKTDLSKFNRKSVPLWIFCEKNIQDTYKKDRFSVKFADQFFLCTYKKFKGDAEYNQCKMPFACTSNKMSRPMALTEIIVQQKLIIVK